MEIFYSVSFVIVFSVFFGQSNGQEGVFCETPNQEPGACISIYQCAPLLNLLKTQSRNPEAVAFLRNSVCFRNGNVPIVCCPTQRVRTPNPFLNPDPSPSTNNAIDPVTDNPYNPPITPSTTSGKLLRKPDCGFSNETNSRIVGGIPAKLGEFPWMVILGYRNSKNPSVPKWLCGASLISYRHVLTAGHCVHGRSDLYLARIGDLDLYSDNDGASPEDILLESAKVHEDYSPVKFTNDIAILKLSKSVTHPSIWPICLPVEDRLRNRDYVRAQPVVAGWGSTNFNGPSSTTLLEVAVPVVTTDECRRAYSKQNSVIDERVLCAGFARGGKDSCKGDSGGPLMFIESEANNVRITQIGVVSYGFRCAEAGYPGVYTRVTNFLDWIERNMK
ncbi:venom protease-like [Harmonia axyridis]|uniref:venom protease-like n=1 Tax=Harmonia axyridis TaxID=115357 RepID=UPI001E277951|nr:venom protease-like [Harmonia axyridis]